MEEGVLKSGQLLDLKEEDHNHAIHKILFLGLHHPRERFMNLILTNSFPVGFSVQIPEDLNPLFWNVASPREGVALALNSK